ncbi:zinc ribbon domain-containing protein [Hespellia stercorisuis]|uniref:DUF4352 domain-containing protein n=1 Tax=Hespellia stercorisuis DSM 15480 TaxID=1121950 RepID=A0A1M6TSF1_9FIRM|nr:zinc ribbon domain-containing protein [Hespellia stercorisuis]SHK59867.1 hypothetical protein SAMN02745243_03315 [Hespellia stercorisuis DSM 15480]
MALIKCEECGKEYSNKAPACPNCGCPTPDFKETVTEAPQEAVPVPPEAAPVPPVAPTPAYTPSAPFTVASEPKKGKSSSKIAVVIAVICGIVVLCGIGFIALSGDSTSSSSKSSEASGVKTAEKMEYVDNIDVVASNPKDYKGKYIKFSGQILSVEESDEIYALQVYTDEHYENSVLVYVKKELADEKFVSDEYVSVDAKIDGAYNGKTIIGVDSTWAKLTALSIEKTTYTDAFSKANSTWNITDCVVDQNGLVVSVDKVEFADNETRVYMTVTNNTTEKCYLWESSTKLVQDGVQHEQTYNFKADHQSLSSEIMPNASSSGILSFEAIDSTKDLQVIVEGHSDDYKLKFSPYTFNVTAPK